MKRVLLTMSVALPGLVLLGLSCSADDAVVIRAGSGGQGGSSTTTTTGAAGDNSSTTSSTTTTTTGGGEGGTGGSGEGGSAVGGMGGGGAGGSGGSSAGSGGMGGTTMPGSPCTPDGNCSAVLKTRGGVPMDGWANIDPPRSTSGPDGIQGNSLVDNKPPAAGDQTCGSPCTETETRPDHGLPLKWASWKLEGPGINAGTTYKVTIRFAGVVECKTYTTLTNCPQPANTGRGSVYDMWCPGGQDPPLNSNPDHYNTYMLSVTPDRSGTTPRIGPMQGPMPTTGNWWMLNECPQGVSEFHLTWQINYEKTINVPAGSWINFTDFDTNCREILNCGSAPDASSTCASHFSLVPTNAVPQPPSTITTQPAAAGANSYGQWIYFDVKSVVPM